MFSNFLSAKEWFDLLEVDVLSVRIQEYKTIRSMYEVPSLETFTTLIGALARNGTFPSITKRIASCIIDTNFPFRPPVTQQSAWRMPLTSCCRTARTMGVISNPTTCC